MPDFIGVFGQIDLGDFMLAAGVKQAKLDPVGAAGEDREIDSFAAGNGPEIVAGSGLNVRDDPVDVQRHDFPTLLDVFHEKPGKKRLIFMQRHNITAEARLESDNAGSLPRFRSSQ
jgi:hypothetical protein